MSVNSFRVKYARIMVPAMFVALIYTIFYAIPQRTKIHQLNADLQRRTIAIEALLPRAQILMHDPKSIRIEVGQSAANASNSTGDSQSAVQTLGMVIHALHCHGVKCSTIEPGIHDSIHPQPFAMRHRVSLMGNFHDVLAAFSSIEETVPQASAVILSMNRTELSEPCRWESEFQFTESPQ